MNQRPQGVPQHAVRAATDMDLDALDALLAPHVARGTVLPRALASDAFLVAEEADRLVGCVALNVWTDEVVELSALVSNRPGLGRRLVEAACARACATEHAAIVALTAVPGFFERCGFEARPVAPWAHARGIARGGPSIAVKAKTCGDCPRLRNCDQIMMARPLRAWIAA